jgi:SM-20-related protein
MQVLDFAAFRAAPLFHNPFDYLILPRFVRPEACAAINADYPAIAEAGSFPLGQLEYGPGFRSLIDALESEEMRSAFEDKFGIDLDGRPTTITARGRCGTRDGNIHTDSTSKLITVLIYLNPAWEAGGGRLRLLRTGKDLDDVVAEVPPIEGTLVAFRRSNNSWHGHKLFIGPRRVVQFNWVTGQRAARLTGLRHGISAFAKRLAGIPRSAFRGSQAAARVG